MKAANVYDAWAEYYDLVHQGLPGEAEFYVGQAVRIGGPTLEMGCGTGRIALPMAMCGVDVTGIDNSAAMLACCREKQRRVEPLKGTLRLIQADIAALPIAASFDYIVMPYRTFMHLLTPAEQQACFQEARRCLAPDGVFLFNTWIPRIPTAAAAERQAEPHQVDSYDLEDGRIDHDFAVTYDRDRQWMHERHLLREYDADGAELGTAALELVRRWTSPREIQVLAEAAGWAVEAIFGDFDCNPVDGTSTEMIWALRGA